MTWLDLPPGTGFGLASLPYGMFSVTPPADPRAGVAIGDQVLDLAAVADDLRLPLRDLFAGPVLNRFLAAGPAAWREARERITEWLTSPAFADELMRLLTGYLDPQRLKPRSRI